MHILNPEGEMTQNSNYNKKLDMKRYKIQFAENKKTEIKQHEIRVGKMRFCRFVIKYLTL